MMLMQASCAAFKDVGRTLFRTSINWTINKSTFHQPTTNQPTNQPIATNSNQIWSSWCAMLAWCWKLRGIQGFWTNTVPVLDIKQSPSPPLTLPSTDVGATPHFWHHRSNSTNCAPPKILPPPFPSPPPPIHVAVSSLTSPRVADEKTGWTFSHTRFSREWLQLWFRLE